MIENLIFKAAIGQHLNQEEKNLIEKSFKQNPELINDYISIKNFINFQDSSLISNSIIIFKDIQKVFSTVEILNHSFVEKKAASVGQKISVFNVAFSWKSLEILIDYQFFTNKIFIKTIDSEKEISLKNSEAELFHIFLSKGKEFSYIFNKSNLILTCENDNLAIFIR